MEVNIMDLSSAPFMLFLAFILIGTLLIVRGITDDSPSETGYTGPTYWGVYEGTSTEEMAGMPPLEIYEPLAEDPEHLAATTKAPSS
jgi:hypothetical protein